MSLQLLDDFGQNLKKSYRNLEILRMTLIGLASRHSL